jgi:hypothetical protein
MVAQKVCLLLIKEGKTKILLRKNFFKFCKNLQIIEKKKWKVLKMDTYTVKKSLEIFGICWEKK